MLQHFLHSINIKIRIYTLRIMKQLGGRPQISLIDKKLVHRSVPLDGFWILFDQLK
ncbi:hypothetical protein C4K27_2160 [Pseudomonas chlororaphis subsp. chlororaphis]|nr:hypothetical protein C4K27_2160 [Pseudomonas chlororaphis subsp. chlororaphis]